MLIQNLALIAILGCACIVQVQSRGLAGVFDKVDDAFDKITGRSDKDEVKAENHVSSEESKKDSDEEGSENKSKYQGGLAQQIAHSVADVTLDRVVDYAKVNAPSAMLRPVISIGASKLDDFMHDKINSSFNKNKEQGEDKPKDEVEHPAVEHSRRRRSVEAEQPKETSTEPSKDDGADDKSEKDSAEEAPEAADQDTSSAAETKPTDEKEHDGTSAEDGEKVATKKGKLTGKVKKIFTKLSNKFGDAATSLSQAATSKLQLKQDVDGKTETKDKAKSDEEEVDTKAAKTEVDDQAKSSEAKSRRKRSVGGPKKRVSFMKKIRNLFGGKDKEPKNDAAAANPAVPAPVPTSVHAVEPASTNAPTVPHPGPVGEPEAVSAPSVDDENNHPVSHIVESAVDHVAANAIGHHDSHSDAEEKEEHDEKSSAEPEPLHDAHPESHEHSKDSKDSEDEKEDEESKDESKHSKDEPLSDNEQDEASDDGHEVKEDKKDSHGEAGDEKDDAADADEEETDEESDGDAKSADETEDEEHEGKKKHSKDDADDDDADKGQSKVSHHDKENKD